MAITELQTPQGFNPAYNDLFHLVNSTNKSKDNFKYIFKVYVGGQYIGKSFKVAPDPTYGFGLFDVKRTVQTYLTYDISLSIVGITACIENNNYYTIGYGEEYGDLSSGVTQYNDLTTSSTKYIYAGSLESLQFIDYVDDTYIMDSSGSLFMTNQPRPFRIFENQKGWLGMMDDTINHIDSVKVVTYTSAGAVIQTAQFNTTVPSNLFVKTISGYNLNDIAQGTLISGTQPLLTDSVSYYTVQAFDGANFISELYRFDIDHTCEWESDNSYDIYFQNVFGWFDSFRFTKQNTMSHDINAKYYKQSTGQFGASSFTVAKTDRAKTQYYTDFSDKWKLKSAYLTEAESTWLLELVTSPQVFINVSGSLIPVTITRNNYDEHRRSEAQIHNLEVEIDFSVKNYRQRY